MNSSLTIIREFVKMGYSNSRIARIAGTTVSNIRAARKGKDISPTILHRLNRYKDLYKDLRRATWNTH